MIEEQTTRAEGILFSRLRVALLAGLAGSLLGCSKTEPQALPPIVYMCPMVKDAEVLQDHSGKCPKCGMELKPVRIVKAYSCLNNTAVIQANPGKCVTNGTELVPITASMYWVCSDSPDKHELNPGKCGDGSDRIQKFEPRLHGDHNPRHGGQLFMADDAWHHLEGTYPSPGFFRVFFYDDWTRPLATDGFSARVIVKDSSGKELAAVPLQASQVANAMEGKLPSGSVPLSASLRVRFKTGESEKFFDFIFREYSREPGSEISTAPEPAPTKQASAAGVNGPLAVSDRTASSGPVEDQRAPAPTGETIATPFRQDPIPSSAREILAELNARNLELSEKIEQGAPLGEYWFPALRTKDLAMALVNDHLTEIPSRQRTAAENAVDRLLRAAYAIDNFGDLGDRERILSAHDAFVLAVNDLRSAYASIR
jgi:hypothetical protein